MPTYRTFKRSARNFEEFATARKTTVDRGLTLSEARARCDAFNNHRTAQERSRGTKLEFEAE